MSTGGQPIAPSANILGPYHFFSRLLPGIALTLGLATLLPSTFILPLADSPAVLVILIFGFAIGQLVHSLGLYLEESVLSLEMTHRGYFHDFLIGETSENTPGNDADNGDAIRNQFREALNREYCLSPDELHSDGLYTLIRSRLEIDNRGRTAQYQVLRSFSRGMMVSLFMSGLLGIAAYASEMITAPDSYFPLVAELSPTAFVSYLA